ncbi:MAG: UMP kinase [Candidatus Lokiarchaeota archaeon]|nr:UMP kinase [Candidatus Lokiarchaeota archaeon]
MKRIVLKIGGSLLFNKDKEIDYRRIIEFSEVIKKNPHFEALVIICGGGVLAREYINATRFLNGNEALCDILGIEISRINSKLLITAFKDLAYPQVPKTIEELSIAQLSKRIVVMGGLQPGQSTTSVALEVAEYINADDVIILTNVNGIYDRDPSKHKDAKLFDKITCKELQEIIIKSSNTNQAAAGEYRIFDAVSLQLLKRSGLTLLVMSGVDINNFKNFWDGKSNFIGTRISN